MADSPPFKRGDVVLVDIGGDDSGFRGIGIVLAQEYSQVYLKWITADPAYYYAHRVHNSDVFVEAAWCTKLLEVSLDVP